MTGWGQEHTPFDELAAGHALHALEPADEQLFLDHAGSCPRCLESLAGFRDVAAALAETSAAAEPSPELGARIMAAALGDLPGSRRIASGAADPGTADARAETDRDQPDDGKTADAIRSAGEADTTAGGTAAGDTTASGTTASGTTASGTTADGTTADGTGTIGAADGPPATVVPLRRPLPRWLRPAAAAAAAAVIAGGGVWAGLDLTAGQAAPSLASCTQERGCSEVTLTAGHRQAAKVLVTNGSAWMVPVSMPTDNPADQIYVLWQFTGKIPRAVGSFDVRAGSETTIKIGKLPAPYHHATVFAISLEHGRAIPASPHLPPVAAG